MFFGNFVLKIFAYSKKKGVHRVYHCSRLSGQILIPGPFISIWYKEVPRYFEDLAAAKKQINQFYKNVKKVKNVFSGWFMRDLIRIDFYWSKAGLIIARIIFSQIRFIKIKTLHHRLF